MHQGVFNGNRVDYFKGIFLHVVVSIQTCETRTGKRAIDALLKSTYPHKNRPLISDRKEAKEWVQKLMEQFNFFFRVERSAQKQLEIDSKQFFEEEGYYVWQWESPSARFKSSLYSFLLIAVVLVGVMFPLWPAELRIGVWYLSMAALGLVGGLFVLAIIRLILYVLSLAVPPLRPGFWLFPNLFADVGIVDSFIPLYGWQGVDYERMHLEKYRMQKKRGKKKAKKTKAGDDSTTDASPAKGKGRAVTVESEEEEVEEIEAEKRPLLKQQ